MEPVVREGSILIRLTLGMTRSGAGGEFRMIVQPREGRAVVSAMKVGFALKAPARVKLEKGMVNGDIALRLTKLRELPEW